MRRFADDAVDVARLLADGPERVAVARLAAAVDEVATRRVAAVVVELPVATLALSGAALELAVVPLRSLLALVRSPSAVRLRPATVDDDARASPSLSLSTLPLTAEPDSTAVRVVRAVAVERVAARVVGARLTGC